MTAELSRPARGPAVFLPVAACFFTSGVAALLYEVVWLRLLGLVFGHTVHAVTTVLATYMGGLALGSWLAGRWADRIARPLRAYALLEAGIGLICAATPLLFAATEALYLPVYRAWQPGAAGSGLLHFALAAVVLLPPTTLMGATLPILSRAVVEDARLAASRVGTLYALNTWGAVVGVAATGFVLLPAVGLHATVWLGIALNLAVAAAALLLERRFQAAGAGSVAPAVAPGTTAAGTGPAAEPPIVPAPAPALDRAQVAVALVAIGLSGAASMAYEVAWTRALGMVLGSSTYAFTAMLATFLVGLALGSVIVSRVLARRAAGLGVFGLLETAIAVLALATLPAFGAIPDALIWLMGRTGVTHGAALSAQFGLSFAVMILPTLAIGATFPLLIAALGTALGRVGHDVGLVYGANTLGTIAGSMVAGFLLVPLAGIEGTVRIAAAVNLAAGLAVLAVAPGAARRLRLAGAAAAALAVLLAFAVPRWDPKTMTSGVPVYVAGMVADGGKGARASRARRELLLYEEGLSTTVAVTRSPTAISLSVNGKTDASNTRDMATQLMLGHLGPVFLPRPERALVIGLASGVTVGAVAQHPFQAIDVAEIEPAMLRAARFFEKENRNVLADPRVRVLEGDGRQILAAATRPYDLIVSEPSNPWIAGVANLFTREFYESARRQLTQDGVMVQWLQAYSIFSQDMQMVVRTFQEVFPHVTVWRGSPGDVLLLGRPAGPACLDQALVEARLAASPGMREDFERFGWTGEGFVFRFVLSEADARRYGAGAPINTDDRPLLEFSAPRALYVANTDENKAVMRGFRAEDRPCVTGLDPLRFAGAGGRLAAARAHLAEGGLEDAELELVRAGPVEALDPAQRAERGRLLFLLGKFEEAWNALSEVAAARPDDPVAQTYLPVLAELGNPAIGERVGKALQPLPGGWYAEPGRLGELLVQLGGERGAPGFFAVALEPLDLALRLNPGRLDALNHRGIALASLGRLDEAEAVLARAAEIDPADARTRFNLGTVQARRRAGGGAP